MSWPWGAYLGEDGAAKGITRDGLVVEAGRPEHDPACAKATGVYLNSMLATTEARRGGYDEGILLTEDGYIADGPGEKIFMVKDGAICTPPI